MKLHSAYQAFQEWLQTAKGQKFAEQEILAMQSVAQVWSGNQLLITSNAWPELGHIGNFSNVTQLGQDELQKRLPFDEGYFNAIIVPHVLQYHMQPQLLVDELLRILQPEGYLLFSGLNPHGGIVTASRWFWPRYSKLRGGNYFSAAKLRKWLQQCNYMKIHYFAGWKCFAQGYIVCAQFRELSMKPLSAKNHRWNSSAVLANRIVHEKS